MHNIPGKKFIAILLILLIFPVLFYLGYRSWRYFFWSGYQVSVNEGLSRAGDVLNRSGPDDFSEKRQTDPRRDVLLVTIDTLRADHLSIYGYSKSTSPFLATLADSGTVYDRAFSASSITTPSHASIFTSLYPKQHGITSNSHALRSKITTLPEILKESGYRTGGFVSTRVHFEPGNLDQGYNRFDQPEANEMMHRPPGSDEPINLDYRPANRTLKQAREWVENYSGDQPFFIWIHLFDPHHPLALRKKEINQVTYQKKQKRNQYIKFVKRHLHIDLRKGQSSYGEHENNWSAYYRLYDSEIFYADQSLKSFYQFFVGQRGEPFTLVTADHGEGLGNHDYWGHGKHIYNEQIRVPLIIHDTESPAGPSRIENVVELNDLLPTILYGVGIDWSSISRLREYPIEGTPLQNLKPEQNLTGSNTFEWAFSQRQVFRWPGIKNRALDFYFELFTNSKNYPFEGRSAANYEPGRETALLNSSGKYIHRTQYSDEYYHQGNDFYEQRNQIGSSGEQIRVHRTTIEEIINQLEESSVPDARRTQTPEELKSLGYVN